MSIWRRAGQVIPGLDEWVFNRDRGRVERELTADSVYASFLQAHPRGEHANARDWPTRIVVVPQADAAPPAWQAANGTFLYEIAQSAREFSGDASVDVFAVDKDESPAQWHTRLLGHLIETRATHVVAQIEADPYRTAERWTWDVFWSQASQLWPGVLLGVTFDSSWQWLEAQSRRLARLSPRFVLVDICMPMDGRLVRGRPEVGPVNMPVTWQSLAVIQEHVGDVERDVDVSFIGALYPDRVEALDALERAGISVQVNPHRQDQARTLDESRRDAPGYVDYMRGLARSKVTINFSKSSAGPYQQLKTRILEAALMGCAIVTDDQDRTSRFWEAGTEFRQFTSIDDLVTTVRSLLADPETTRTMGERARTRARELNSAALWEEINRVLALRGLAQVKPS